MFPNIPGPAWLNWLYPWDRLLDEGTDPIRKQRGRGISEPIAICESAFNKIRTFVFYFFKINFNITFHSRPGSLQREF